MGLFAHTEGRKHFVNGSFGGILTGQAGKGTLRIIYDLAMREPYSGVVEIQSGEIADDIAYYLTSSDQIPSAVSLGVLFNDDSSVREAGGFIVQLMDGATDETAALLEERIASLPSVTTMLSEGETPESILERILGDMDLQILEDGPVAFRCDCTRERTLKLLSLVSADELQDMVDEGEDVEMVCAFCNSKYQYSPDEIAALIEEQGERRGRSNPGFLWIESLATPQIAGWRNSARRCR